MPLRDDHEAALARADALQRELDEERAKDAIEDAHAARLEIELGRARERAERAEAKLARSTSENAADLRARGLRRLRWFAITAGSAASLFILYALCDTKYVAKPHYVADDLVVQGRAMIERGFMVKVMRLEGIAADGTLDPHDGLISILAGPPAPPAPPGAVFHSAPIMRCTHATWTPGGWDLNIRSCNPLVPAPQHEPRCTPARLVRFAGVSGTVNIEVQWDGDEWQWIVVTNRFDPESGQTYSDTRCASR